ncbi:sortase domain-bontaining protein [Aeromicrobium sp. UC242_57]|uniref:sortase domain-containing protein n=1 Tax=Aeromicrobium sp. UC242_57 TaxID=3374624 RepID=UPI0037A7D267
MTAMLNGRRRASQPAQVWPILPRADRSPVTLAESTSIISTSLTVFAIVLMWFLAQLLFLSGIEQGRAQERLYLDFRTQVAGATAPTGGVIAPGSPVALFSIPSLGYEQVVSEGTSSGVLINGLGHRRDTVLPGQAGVSIIYGKSRTFGKPMAAMLTDATGRTLTVTTGQGESTYKISKVRRGGDPMPVPPTGTGSRITMVTSEGSGSLGALSPSKVVYVDAELVGKSYLAPGGRPNTVSTIETAMAGDKTVMPSLALALGALALVTVGSIWSRHRFGLVRTWIIAAPIVVALAWLTSDLTMYLLPNLL